MAAPNFLAGLEQRLRGDGAEVSVVPWLGGQAVVGYRPRFRLAWAATKLHLFTIGIYLPAATGSSLTQFAEDTVDYAIKLRGGARGFQSGVATIALVAADQVDESAVQVPNDTLVRRFAAFSWPALLDLRTGATYRHEGRVMLGGIYGKWLRAQSDLALGRTGKWQQPLG